jgi:hypothetical protein
MLGSVKFGIVRSVMIRLGKIKLGYVTLSKVKF